MADVAHYAGLIIAGIYPSPVPYADFVTATTHKTLRGPRGGLILCKKKYSQLIDRMIFPGAQGGPLMHVITAKAVAFGEAMKPKFVLYQKQILNNARALSVALSKRGFRIVSGGTDCHMFLVDLTSRNIDGLQAQQILEKAGITVNKNTIPHDQLKPFVTSGIRIGTPAVTTRGLKEPEMDLIAEWIDISLAHRRDEKYLAELRRKIARFCKNYPLHRG